MDRRNLVYARIETLAPGTTRDLRARIGPGRYLWKCAGPTGLEKFSEIRTVSGPDVRGVEPYLPVANNDMLLPTLNLRTATSAQIGRLVADTDALVAIASSGSVDEVRRAWLDAHLDYVRLGSAYGTFGELDAAVNGGSEGLEGGVDDPSWTGFRKLEHLLWNDGSRPEIVAVASQLGADVHRLQADFPTSTPERNEAALRAQEILENSMEFDLSGRHDEGSHTGLANVRASVDATRTVLDAVGPLVEARRPGVMGRAREALDRLTAELDRHRAADGAWASLDSLTPEQRRRVDGLVAQALEDLSSIPRVLEISPNEVNE
jgi:iron uptake system EfeUOB component EfeO/EfeM